MDKVVEPTRANGQRYGVLHRWSDNIYTYFYYNINVKIRTVSCRMCVCDVKKNCVFGGTISQVNRNVKVV